MALPCSDTAQAVGLPRTCVTISSLARGSVRAILTLTPPPGGGGGHGEEGSMEKGSELEVARIAAENEDGEEGGRCE